MKHRYNRWGTFLTVFLLLGFLTQCQKKVAEKITASVVQTGYINCFSAGLRFDDGDLIWGEPSAVVVDQGKLYLALDKDFPKKNSSVFVLPWQNDSINQQGTPTYLMNKTLKRGHKYEEFTKSPDNKWVLLTSGFDRTKRPKSTAWDGYNMLCYWPSGQVDSVKVYSENGTDSTSISLRYKLAAALRTKQFPQAMPYFKIEGLTLTDSLIIFGIREYGKDYKHAHYAIKLVAASYAFKNNRLLIAADFKVLTTIKAHKYNSAIQGAVGISSIQYDAYNHRFYILTSLEQKGLPLKTFLWTATLGELKNNYMQPVLDPSGKPLVFAHKVEDIAVLDARHLFLIADDDRDKTVLNEQVRQPNQAAYFVVALKGM